MRNSIKPNTPITREQIVKTFQKYGYFASTMISKDKMNGILNAEHKKKQGSLVHQELLNELWNESTANSKGQISISSIVETVLVVQSILENKIDNLSSNTGYLSHLDKSIFEKQQEIRELMNNQNDNRTKIIQPSQDVMSKQVQQKQNQLDLQTFISDYKALSKIFKEERSLGYHATQNNYNQQGQFSYTLNGINNNKPENLLKPANKVIHPTNTQPVLVESAPLQPIQMPSGFAQNNGLQAPPKRLLILLYLTCILTAFQLVIMSSLRVSMLPLTAYLHSFYILFFGMPCFDSLTYLIGHFLFTVISDVCFLVVKFASKEDILPYEHSTYFLYVSLLILLLIATIVLRCLLIGLLWPIRTTAYNVNHNQNLYLMDNTIPLFPSHNNYLSQIFANSQDIVNYSKIHNKTLERQPLIYKTSPFPIQSSSSFQQPSTNNCMPKISSKELYIIREHTPTNHFEEEKTEHQSPQKIHMVPKLLTHN